MFLMRYSWILFDADETLFSFDSFSGLRQMFSEFGVDFTRQDYERFELTNKLLWVKYQDGEIDAYALQTIRFNEWAERLDVDPLILNTHYQNAMATICQPLDGVIETLPILAQHSRLAIITNGFSQLQQARLENTGLTDVFEFVLVSEEVGCAKPDVQIFEKALEKMGFPDKKSVLMIGDNPDSDILGGQNIGFDTAWLNRNKSAITQGVLPTYEFSNWDEIKTFFS